MSPRREADISVPGVALTVRDRLVFDEMKRMVGIASDADVLRLGLYHLARHLDIRLDMETFKFRRGKTVRRR